MNIKNLKMLKILDRCQSISKAAACLYLSQSTLTRQLIMMEKELGFTLFYRLPEGVKPTLGGRYFIDQLDALLDSYDSAVAGARQRSFTLAQTVRIGITSYMIHFVPQACRTAQPHFQNVRFDYVVCRLPETYQALDIERIYFETPEQAEALSLAQKIPIMTLAFPSEKDCFSVALLKEVPSVKLGMIFRKKDQAELEPLLNYFRAYFIRHQQDFLPLKPLISNMTA